MPENKREREKKLPVPPLDEDAVLPGEDDLDDYTVDDQDDEEDD